MKTRKNFLLAAAFVLLVGSGGIMAQSTRDSAFRIPPELVPPVTTIDAIEVTDGTVGYDAQGKQEIQFGYSFLGRTTGAFPGSFTMFMNCTTRHQLLGDPGEVTGDALGASTSELTGGAWTLPVYVAALKGGGYAGSLYGTIAKGTMNYDKLGTSANVYIVLNVDGGTQSWEGITGFATFTGTLFVDEKTQKTMLSGDLVFNTIGAMAE
jgi:hypothetical protein